MVAGRTISPMPARPGEGAVAEPSRKKLPDARLPDRPLSGGIDVQDWRILLIANKSYIPPLLIPISTLLGGSCMLIPPIHLSSHSKNMCNFGKIYRPMTHTQLRAVNACHPAMKCTMVLHEMSSQV